MYSLRFKGVLVFLYILLTLTAFSQSPVWNDPQDKNSKNDSKKNNLSYHMPEWKVFIDKENNRYFFDQNGKIKTLGEPLYNFKPVSADGIEFYINHGEELVKRRYRAEGLGILRSIIAMPASDNRVIIAQKRAGKIINNLIRKQGTRYDQLKIDSSILLFKNNNKVIVINDLMRYQIHSKGNLYIIKKRMRHKHNYLYNGITFGYSKETKFNKKTKIFDAIIAIDSERYSYKIKSIQMIVNHWSSILGLDVRNRKVIVKNNKMQLSTFESASEPRYGGFEGLYLNSNYSYCIKIILPIEAFKIKYKEIKSIADSFSFADGGSTY